VACRLTADTRDFGAVTGSNNCSAYCSTAKGEEYESNGKTGKRRTKIGAAFPHKKGLGFSIELIAFPVDGRFVVLPPDGNDDRSNK
jgi:hypothetical protein